MCSRADGALAYPPGVVRTDGSSRWTMRTRSGAFSGAPASRGRLVAVGRADRPVRDPLVPEPGAAEQRVVASISPWSLRQLTSSVACAVASRAASR